MIHYQMTPVETGYTCSAHSSTPDWLMEHLEAVMVEHQEERIGLGSELHYYNIALRTVVVAC